MAGEARLHPDVRGDRPGEVRDDAAATTSPTTSAAGACRSTTTGSTGSADTRSRSRSPRRSSSSTARHGFTLDNLRTTNRLGCNQFVFVRSACRLTRTPAALAPPHNPISPHDRSHPSPIIPMGASVRFFARCCRSLTGSSGLSPNWPGTGRGTTCQSVLKVCSWPRWPSLRPRCHSPAGRSSPNGPKRGTAEYYCQRADDPVGERQKFHHGKAWPPFARPCGPEQTCVHKYHANHYWPYPYNVQDQSDVRLALQTQVNNGWCTATTLYDYHFDRVDASAQQLGPAAPELDLHAHAAAVPADLYRERSERRAERGSHAERSAGSGELLHRRHVDSDHAAGDARARPAGDGGRTDLHERRIERPAARHRVPGGRIGGPELITGRICRNTNTPRPAIRPREVCLHFAVRQGLPAADPHIRIDRADGRSGVRTDLRNRYRRQTFVQSAVRRKPMNRRDTGSAHGCAVRCRLTLTT